jgi:hypothetical protein
MRGDILLPTIPSAYIIVSGKSGLTAAACSSAEYPCDIVDVRSVVYCYCTVGDMVSSRYQVQNSQLSGVQIAINPAI